MLSAKKQKVYRLLIKRLHYGFYVFGSLLARPGYAAARSRSLLRFIVLGYVLSILELWHARRSEAKVAICIIRPRPQLLAGTINLSFQILLQQGNNVSYIIIQLD